MPVPESSAPANPTPIVIPSPNTPTSAPETAPELPPAGTPIPVVPVQEGTSGERAPF
ncbi:hypothetical protein FRUB_10541 [Fimbriiglobus ruber]|uniref:Uncharacterized protein n=1 Tax=Fimbriiglobus ruber TaxID=1908690 RepID=A0A225CYW0_9BACT|nr:hypothetical protein FRUB_10541 [Fimbriiglobus ruber]